MKKNVQKPHVTKSSYSRVFTSALIFLGTVLLGTVGIFAATNLDTLKKTPFNNNNNTLTAADWNTLVDAVKAVQESASAAGGGGIPAGAVMAFDLSSCPSGWSRFSAADNKFIMGANSNFGDTGGSDSIYLNTSQLPAHSHYLFFPNYTPLKNRGRDHSSPSKDRAAIDDHYHEKGDNNYSMTVWYANETASYGKSSSIGNGASINILNPYIKLTYCKKN